MAGKSAVLSLVREGRCSVEGDQLWLSGVSVEEALNQEDDNG